MMTMMINLYVVDYTLQLPLFDDKGKAGAGGGRH